MEKLKESLIELFDEWKLAHISDDNPKKTCPYGMDTNKAFVESFIADGCVNYDKYSKSKRKILFLLKEPGSLREEQYIANENPKEQMDYHWFKKDVVENEDRSDGNLKYYKKFKIMADILNVSLEETAMMNINKRGGYSKGTDDAKLTGYIDSFRDKIERQIELLSPDIIIACIGNGRPRARLFNVDNKAGWFEIKAKGKYTKWLYEGTYKGKIKVYGMEHPGSPIGYEKYREYFLQVNEHIN